MLIFARIVHTFNFVFHKFSDERVTYFE